MNKATKAESEARVSAVYKLLAARTSPGEIVEYAEQNWGIGKTQTYTYISRANAEFARRAEIHRDAEFGRVVENMNALYQASLKLQDYKTCLAVLKEIGALMGLYAPTRQEVTGKDGGAIVVTWGEPVLGHDDSDD